MNTSIVIALPKIEDAKKIRTVLNRYGFTVAAVCNSGANALASISELDGGVLLCGYHLQDMYYRDLLDYMPDYFEMLLMASRGVISEAPTSILCVGMPILSVEMPIKSGDLVNTVSMILMQQERKRRKEKKKPKLRSEKEQNYISNAKMLLMERNHLSEDDAYRYIQKCSMDSGTNMVETAQMVLMLLYDSV